MASLQEARASAKTVESRRRTSRVSLWTYFFYCELMKIFRNPAAVVFGLGFPTLFFLIFGFSFGSGYAAALVGAYAAYGAFIVAFQTFSISLANERSLGWNKLLRSTSMSTALFLGAKFLVIIITGILSLLLLFAVAGGSGKVHLAWETWAALLGMMVLGMVPTGLMGLFLGFLGSTNVTSALSTTLGLLLSFASGYFIPLSLLPTVLQKVAPYLPTYQLGQLAWAALDIKPGGPYGPDSQPLWVHFAALGGYAAVFLVLSAWAYIRDESTNFS
jgi:ABC-2 type transport system permease protein